MLGIISLIAAFMVGLLGSFPLGVVTGDQVDPPVPTESIPTESIPGLDIDSVKQATNQLSSMYGVIIDDIISFKHDPSLDRAEARHHAMLEYAQKVAGSLQDFSRKLLDTLDSLIFWSNDDGGEEGSAVVDQSPLDPQ